MKHGDKAKAKSAKAKASGKEASSKKAVAKSSQSAGESKAAKAGGSQKDSRKTAEKSNSLPVAKASTSKGKTVRAVPPPAGGFTNPLIGEAFKRAVKKYATAFRRLTD